MQKKKGATIEMRISATINQILVLCRRLTPLLPLVVLIEFILRPLYVQRCCALRDAGFRGHVQALVDSARPLVDC